jgi:hypothetical protein
MLGLVTNTGRVGQGFGRDVQHGFGSGGGGTPTLVRMGVCILRNARSAYAGRSRSSSSREPMRSMPSTDVVSQVPARTNVQALP